MSNRNEEYYLEDIIFQVEDQLFKVHRHMFVQLSVVFRDMFTIPVPGGVEADGSSDKQPLVLEGIEKKDFVLLLRCLYPLNFQGDLESSFSLEEWRSVLKLAALYEMDKIKAFAVKKMTPLLTGSPSLQIHLAKVYDIKEWLAPGLVRLVNHVRPLDEEDVKLIGLSDALKVCSLRDKITRCEACRSGGRRKHSCMPGMGEVCEIFEISGSGVVEGISASEIQDRLAVGLAMNDDDDDDDDD
ncbi:hypothetical protein AX15_001876 [Amanita polypyramis BW_CC]|nr:hypothetical protein AX15_001876 [Amanita polypyramis BW_CC]